MLPTGWSLAVKLDLRMLCALNIDHGLYIVSIRIKQIACRKARSQQLGEPHRWVA